MRKEPGPPCSVVIAWVNSFDLLEPVLVALAQQSTPAAEIILATRRPESDRVRLSEAFPAVHLISASPDTTIPVLRALGIRASRGEVVLVTEDHCVPSPAWIARATASIQEGNSAVGGPVENIWPSRLRDSAAFLTEYSGVLRPAPEGIRNVIPGNNVAYRRDVALEIADSLNDGLWESFALEHISGRGHHIAFDRDMLVYHCRPFGFRYFMGQRFHFCRAWAAMSRRFLPRLPRAARAAASVLLPCVLLIRSWRNLAARKRLTAQFAVCAPLIFVYFCVGAAGEMLGYALGGGHSLAHVE
jgi:hypothetical protein